MIANENREKLQNPRKSTNSDHPLLGNENVSGKILQAKFLGSCQLTFSKISADSETSTFSKCPANLDS